MRIIDADALLALVQERHDFFRGCTHEPDKARRDELLQMMVDISEQPTVDAIPISWLQDKRVEASIEGEHPDINRCRVYAEVIDAWDNERELRA